MSDPRTRTVIVALPDGTRADWLHVVQVLAWHDLPAVVPFVVFPVRRRRLLGWVSRWTARHLVDPVRRRGAVTLAAGGRRSRLDLAPPRCLWGANGLFGWLPGSNVIEMLGWAWSLMLGKVLVNNACGDRRRSL